MPVHIGIEEPGPNIHRCFRASPSKTMCVCSCTPNVHYNLTSYGESILVFDLATFGLWRCVCVCDVRVVLTIFLLNLCNGNDMMLPCSVIIEFVTMQTHRCIPIYILFHSFFPLDHTCSHFISHILRFRYLVLLLSLLSELSMQYYTVRIYSFFISQITFLNAFYNTLWIWISSNLKAISLKSTFGTKQWRKFKKKWNFLFCETTIKVQLQSHRRRWVQNVKYSWWDFSSTGLFSIREIDTGERSSNSKIRSENVDWDAEYWYNSQFSYTCAVSYYIYPTSNNTFVDFK